MAGQIGFSNTPPTKQARFNNIIFSLKEIIVWWAVNLRNTFVWRLLFADAFQLDVKSQASLLAVAGGYVSAVEEDGMLYYIEELMQELQKEVTILIVTHNMGQAMRISSKSMFMYLGELVEYGDTATMFSNPSDERTKAYLTGKMG